MKPMLFRSRILAAAIAASLFQGVLAISAADTGRAFPSPEAAANSLALAAGAKDFAALRAILGPDAAALVNPDEVQATNEFANFAAALSETNRLVRESDTRRVLEVGTNHWPFPVPIVQTGGQWRFDTAAGKEEILNRRIGRNELAALDAVRAYVGAQREYASRDRDGDSVLEYAQNFLSTPGHKDGLYWSPEPDGEVSPLGPLVAAAQGEGYMRSTGEKSSPKPFHGYLFKILTRLGKQAPGGKYDYVINGNMIAGFALVAWPAQYGASGIMTFIVNQQGRVYQKDLGPNTAKAAVAMKEYDPDKTWSASAD